MRFWILAALFAANVFAWSIPVPHGLQVFVLDVGQGKAVLVQGPAGAVVLVDGGPDSSVLRGIGATLPFFTRSLDAVIVTGSDSGSIGGLPGVFERYRVRTFIAPDDPGDTKAAAALAQSAAASGAQRVAMESGMRILLGRGAYADIARAADSTIVRVVYGETSILLAGNASVKAQKKLLSSGIDIRSDVILAPHYGSKDSVLPAFAAAVASRYAVFSSSCDNRWGYPVPETVSLFGNLGVRTLTTCKNGTVTFRLDAMHLIVPVFLAAV